MNEREWEKHHLRNSVRTYIAYTDRYGQTRRIIFRCNRMGVFRYLVTDFHRNVFYSADSIVVDDWQNLTEEDVKYLHER